ncbi:MAG TPA: class I SAM-dependent methyltransferase [bacterium]|nr:class I SAM-dependent methyltransferase [bacterium]HPN44992.1 class I SAM-dependent methyltransferase [bacterium]
MNETGVKTPAQITADWPDLEFIEKIKPANIASHSFSSQYGYLCYIALYKFAATFCEAKTVLDAACGLGFGSYLLAHKAAQVTGVEIVAQVIDYARSNYKKDNMQFIHADATSLDFADHSFDLVVSLETFEHIPRDKAGKFLNELQRVLKPGGILVLSTPNHDVYSKISQTPDHVNELNVDELESLLTQYFADCQPYYQRKGVLQTTGKYYAFVSKDRLKLRRFIPNRLRNLIRRFTAPQLQKNPQEILQEVQVHRAVNKDDVKNAVVQIWVCSKK